METNNRHANIENEEVSYLSQFIDTLSAHQEAVQFIIRHKLWEGFWKYSWVLRMLIFAAILFSLNSLNIFIKWLDRFNTSETVNTFEEMGVLMEKMALDNYNFLFSGSLKYIILILIEVVIFHICRRTMEILSGETSDLTFNTFLKAQVRMIKVVIRAYFMEMVVTVLIKIGFGIFSAYDFLEPVLIFAAQCYFLGILVLDNYNEQFHLTIKDSLKYARRFKGVALAVGLLLNIFLMIPLIGPIVGPAIAAVAVTLVMYKISDIHLLDEVPPNELA